MIPSPESPKAPPETPKGRDLSQAQSVLAQRLCDAVNEFNDADGSITFTTVADACGALEISLDEGLPKEEAGKYDYAARDLLMVPQVESKPVAGATPVSLVSPAPGPLDADFLTLLLGWMVGVDSFICKSHPAWAKDGKRYADQLSAGIRAMEAQPPAPTPTRYTGGGQAVELPQTRLRSVQGIGVLRRQRPRPKG